MPQLVNLSLKNIFMDYAKWGGDDNGKALQKNQCFNVVEL